MKIIMSFVAGLIFALGLGLSGMMNPQKVRDFLDITRNWDPSLIFVMVGAISVYAVAYRHIICRSKPLCEVEFLLPTKRKVDAKLVTGAGLFGIGWSIAGICPGPAISNLGTGLVEAVIFVIVMAFGIGLVKIMEKRS